MKRLLLAGVLIALLSSAARAGSQKHTFALGDSSFLLDGKPVVLRSGEMHFARIPREYWRDRLRMAKAMGLNTIATYVFWNYHEPEKGRYNFKGNADVAEFVRIAGEEGLWVLVRPSAYACAEWEFGGYPWWLLKEDGMKVRSRDPKFLGLVKKYFAELGKQLAPLQITRGGNIIMVQIENEYGSYDQDKEYLALNRDFIRAAGFDVDLYTCDGPSQMPRGYLPGLLPAVNGLDNIPEVKDLVRRYHDGKGPFFIAEWYPAWFDTWGLDHHVVPASEYTSTLENVLSHGVSINMYMAHGGTSFGFMNGANMDYSMPYSPQVTSYDYDAPIDEAGNATQKFMAFREVIARHLLPGETLPPVPARKIAKALPPIALTETSDLFARLPAPVTAMQPLSFEDLNQGYGFVLYRTTLHGPSEGLLSIEHVCDYALVYVNNRRVGMLDRRLGQDSLKIDLPAGEATLDILVENLGRINYGPFLNDNRKGITKQVLLNGEVVSGWSMYRLPLSSLSGVTFSASSVGSGPVLRRGRFSVSEIADTYLDMSSWTKGLVWINGHNLGRYWRVGPQQTLYVPGPWLRKGINDVVVLDLMGDGPSRLLTRDTPILDELGDPVVTIRGTFDTTSRTCTLKLATKGRDHEIRYTLDGTRPTAASALYASELPVATTATVSARAFRHGAPSDVVSSRPIRFSRATGKHVTYARPFSAAHPAAGARALVDCLQGAANVDDPYWQGFEGDDCEAVIDLGSPVLLNRLSARFLQATRSWVFFPTSVVFSVSANDTDFVEVGRIDIPVAGKHEPTSIRECAAALSHGTARYVKVTAKNVGVCPSWHGGKGGKAWVFIDEIVAD
jgi:beta-galactosidase